MEYEGNKTIWDAYMKTLKKFPNHKHLGTRNFDKEGAPYEWKTFREVHDLAINFAKGKVIQVLRFMIHSRRFVSS